MSDSVSQVREIARSLGISIPEDRLEQLASAYEATLKEVEAARQSQTPLPTPSPYDAGWEVKR